MFCLICYVMQCISFEFNRFYFLTHNLTFAAKVSMLVNKLSFCEMAHAR